LGCCCIRSNQNMHCFFSIHTAESWFFLRFYSSFLLYIPVPSTV
jgi:hypothetical protein